jgi:hypothetical protein
MVTVLPESGRAGIHKETFSGFAEASFAPWTVPKGPKWQDRRMITDEEES